MREIGEKEYKEIILNVLVDIDRFCTDNDIRYYLIGGTLLGAVRHKGFIPWDDDIDIVMPRKDYLRFIKEYTSPEDKYRVMSLLNNDKYYQQYAKVYDTRTVLRERGRGVIDIGAFVDVFPIDYGGSNLEDLKKLNRKIAFYRKALKSKVCPVNEQRTFVNNALAAAASVLPMDIKTLIQTIDRLAQTYTDEKSKYWAALVIMTYGEREIFEAEWFGEPGKLEFEGHYFDAPCDPHNVLKSLYGTYMELPPVEKRVSTHLYDVWYKE